MMVYLSGVVVGGDMAELAVVWCEERRVDGGCWSCLGGKERRPGMEWNGKYFRVGR